MSEVTQTETADLAADGTNATIANTDLDVAGDTATQPAEDMIPKSELNKVLDDAMKYKKLAREREQQLKAAEMDKLKEQENWQKIAELKEQEAAEAREKLNGLQEHVEYSTKYDAVKTAALKAGIRQEALSDLDLVALDDVVIERTSTGRTNVLGAERFVEGLKQSRPHWFGGNGLNVANSNPGVKVTSQGQLTVQMVSELYSKAMKTGAKSDLAAYQDAFHKLRAQRK